MPEREAIRAAIMQLQIVAGWVFPNAVMQYALPRLEQFTIDIDRLQRRRDRLVGAMTAMGYAVNRPEGTFYLWVRSPIGDDAAFARQLTEHDIFVLPGYMFETPGFFRICLTANDDMIGRSLPGFASAMAHVQSEQPAFIST